MKPISCIAGMLLCVLFALPAGARSPNSPPSGEELTGVLTLPKVVTHVLLHNPELKAFNLEIRAREARAVQAGLLPNPHILLDTQDVLGSGPFRGASQSQNTVTLSQVIQLGGKRTRREKAALLKRDLAQWDYETRRMDVLTGVAQNFVRALVAQEQLRLAEEQVQRSENFLHAVIERVNAGKVSPIQKVKAEVTVSTTRVQRDQAHQMVQDAHRQLALFWGSVSPRFEKVAGNLLEVQPVPDYVSLTQRLQRNPILARWATEVLHRQAKVDLEESLAIPDVRVGAGARWFQETHDNTFIFELSVPLQWFDRNQGAIAEARHRLEQVDAEKRAEKIRLNRVLSQEYRRLSQAFRQVIAFKTRILPGAQTAYNAVNEGYRYGKFGYLELLDSQRTLFDARGQFLQALSDYHLARAGVERLIGEPLGNFAAHPSSQKGGVEP